MSRRASGPRLARAGGREIRRRRKIARPAGAGRTPTYRVWQQTDPAGGAARKYLVDDSGAAVWLVDPGINGAFKTRPDGTQVRKFDAPKAVLMSYIIKGMLGASCRGAWCCSAS